MKIYLGGTTNGSRWREDFRALLNAEYMQPVADGMRAGHDPEFEMELEGCQWLLTVITPRILGFDDVFMLIEDSNKRTAKTVFCFIEQDEGFKFSPHQIKSLNATGKMVEQNGGYWAKSLQEAADYMQGKPVETKA